MSISPTPPAPPDPTPATTSHDKNKVLIVVGAVVLTGLFVWKRLRKFCVKEATTARIISQVCSARKEMAFPAAMKMKLTIELMRRDKRDAGSICQYLADLSPRLCPVLSGRLLSLL